MANVSAKRQALFLEASTEGERKWKTPNEGVKIRRKLSRRPSLKQSGNQQNHYQRENVLPLGRRASGDGRSKTPTGKRASETDLTASHTPPKRSRKGLQDISNSPVGSPDKGTKLRDNHCKQQVQLATPTTTPTNQELTPRPVLCLYPRAGSSSPDNSLPLDWALKTRVRFISPFPFTWTQSLKPQQEASGIAQFMKSDAEKGSSDHQTALQQSLMLWSHPSLPFLKTFPRTETKQTATHTPTLLQDADVLQALRDDWSTSLCSVYQLLKCGFCPYFYLCANQFTALFLSAGVCGCSSLSAMITPTTSGMREALKKEGAELTLPLAPTGPPEEECSDTEDDSAATSWLASMGLPVNDFPALHPQKIALQRSREVNIDNRPESVARVEGSSVHALFNFMLTSKTTITTTGSHAGIPPTILAPVGFKGATLKALKMRQGSVQEQGEDKMVRRYYLDLAGPILPQNLHNLCCVLRTTQHGQFTAHPNNVESTGAFNATTDREQETAGRPFGSESYLQKKPLGQKTGLREIACEGCHYTCK